MRTDRAPAGQRSSLRVQRRLAETVAAGFTLIVTNVGSVDCKGQDAAVAHEALTACNELSLRIRVKDGHQVGATFVDSDEHLDPAE